MTYAHYDRLTALDSAFLDIEDHAVHMHVGAVGIFEAGPLTTADGGFDFARIQDLAESTLRRAPRFRQRLARVPLSGNPVWVDDDRFNLHYHLRHTCLPHPGDERQLKRLAGRIMSQQLDRGKPLWEMWFVEGLDRDRFAIISKVHHSVIDGISGTDLIGTLMQPTREAHLGPKSAWVPRQQPSAARLLADDVWRRATAPLQAVRAGFGSLGAPITSLDRARDAVRGVGEALGMGLSSASPTPLNIAIGPHRRFDWVRLDLGAVRDVKKRHGATVNDVVLTIVAGAMRRFLKNRGCDVRTLDFRALVPVSVRTASQRGALGNRVSFLVAGLPIDERNPERRLKRVMETMQQLKQSKQVLGAEVIEELSDWTTRTLFTQFARLGARSLAYNMVVTNVPGPQMPVYCLGAEMLASYPLVPLYTNQALGIAIFSYNGGLFFGLNADWDAVPDLHDVADAIRDEYEALALPAAEGAPTATTDQVPAENGHDVAAS